MRHTLLLLTFLFGTISLKAQPGSPSVNPETLNLYYYEQAPYAYKPNVAGDVIGIEAEIVREFIQWAGDKKARPITLEYTAHLDFPSFYNGIKSGAKNAMGCGSLVATDARRSEMAFSVPYLKNPAVLVTDGRVGTLANLDEMKTKFQGLVAVSVRGTIYAGYVEDLKKQMPELTVEYVNSMAEVLNKLREDKKYFAYIDVITYWNYLKANPSFVKLHRVADREGEQYSFAFPLKTDYQLLFSEFFEGGLGFTTTLMYRNIIERYLGYEMVEFVKM